MARWNLDCSKRMDSSNKCQPTEDWCTHQIKLQTIVSVVQDQSKNSTAYEGFAIDLFQATVGSLPYYLPYNFTPFDGTYDEIVEQVYFKVRSSSLPLTYSSH